MNIDDHPDLDIDCDEMICKIMYPYDFNAKSMNIRQMQ